MDVLDERVLRDDDAVGQDGAVRVAAAHEPAPLELSEEAELTELRQPQGQRRRPGPDPAPRSASPCRTASEAISAAPRAASSRVSPRARSAVRLAECVQPAPWVASSPSRSTAMGTCCRPSKSQSTASAAVTSGDDHRGRAECVQRLGERAPVGVVRVREPEQRAGLVEVRRDHRRERKELLDEHGDRVVLEQRRARTRRPSPDRRRAERPVRAGSRRRPR